MRFFLGLVLAAVRKDKSSTAYSPLDEERLPLVDHDSLAHGASDLWDEAPWMEGQNDERTQRATPVAYGQVVPEGVVQNPLHEPQRYEDLDRATPVTRGQVVPDEVRDLMNEPVPVGSFMLGLDAMAGLEDRLSADGLEQCVYSPHLENHHSFAQECCVAPDCELAQMPNGAKAPHLIPDCETPCSKEVAVKFMIKQFGQQIKALDGGAVGQSSRDARQAMLDTVMAAVGDFPPEQIVQYLAEQQLLEEATHNVAISQLDFATEDDLRGDGRGI